MEIAGPNTSSSFVWTPPPHPPTHHPMKRPAAANIMVMKKCRKKEKPAAAGARMRRSRANHMEQKKSIREKNLKTYARRRAKAGKDVSTGFVELRSMVRAEAAKVRKAAKDLILSLLVD